MADKRDDQSITQTAGRIGPGSGPAPGSAEKAAIDAARVQADAAGNAGQAIDSGSMSGVRNAPQIDGYEFVRELHRGGQGVVYQALEKATKRKVAIKILLDGTYASEAARKRFEREIELAASLKHPHIVAVFHSGLTADGRQFCVMDYIRGVPLHHYVRDQKLPLDAALNLFAKVCDAVHYAHQKGVIHRDLKPGNILVDTEGSPKVLDFGLARQVGGPEQTILSMTGQVVGTLQYMSPEQTRGNPDEIDIRTDVYSLGVILYELLTGKFPYPVAGQMIDVVRHIVSTEPTPPSRTWNADSGIMQKSSMRKSRVACPIDDELQTIIMRALTKERQRRYQTAADLGADIEHYLRNEPIEAKRDSTLYVLKKRLRRNRVPVAVISLFLVTLTSFAIIFSVSSRRERERIERERTLERERVERERAEDKKKREQRSEDLVEEASPYVSPAEYAKAEPLLREAIELNPTNFAALMNFATAKRYQFEKTRDINVIDDAIGLIDRAANIDPHRAEPFNVKGILLRDVKRLDEAVVAFKQGILADSQYAPIYVSFANALALKGDWIAAESNLTKATTLPVTDGDDRPWQRWHNLAMIQLILDRPEAIASVQQALQNQGSENPYVRLAEARARLWWNEAVNAPAALEAAVVADRSDAIDVWRAKRMLALAELKMKAWTKAAAAARQALKASDPFPVQANLIAAIALAQLGSRDEARLHFDVAIRDWPTELEAAPKGVKVSLTTGLIWFESFAECKALRDEAEKLLATPATAPAHPPEKTGS